MATLLQAAMLEGWRFCYRVGVALWRRRPEYHVMENHRRALYIVKPADSTAGEHGVTTNVTTRIALIKLVAQARVCSCKFVLEEQIAGSVYRLLSVDGELIDCVLRVPPTLVGDGISTIRKLAKAENDKRRKAGLKLSQVAGPTCAT